MATKQAGCLGRILSAAFTSVVAPVLVGLALHDLNDRDLRPRQDAPAWAGVSRADGAPMTDVLPGRRQNTSQLPPPQRPIPDQDPPALLRPALSPQTTGASRGVDWTRPSPLRR
jgi:hypothetical protein